GLFAGFAAPALAQPDQAGDQGGFQGDAAPVGIGDHRSQQRQQHGVAAHGPQPAAQPAQPDRSQAVARLGHQGFGSQLAGQPAGATPDGHAFVAGAHAQQFDAQAAVGHGGPRGAIRGLRVHGMSSGIGSSSLEAPSERPAGSAPPPAGASSREAGSAVPANARASSRSTSTVTANGSGSCLRRRISQHARAAPMAAYSSASKPRARKRYSVGQNARAAARVATSSASSRKIAATSNTARRHSRRSPASRASSPSSSRRVPARAASWAARSEKARPSGPIGPCLAARQQRAQQQAGHPGDSHGLP